MNALRVDHTAIVVRDMDEAIERYQRLYGVQVRDRTHVPEQGVEVAFLALGNTQLELVCPMAGASGVARFLKKRGESLHHIGLLVGDIREELRELAGAGVALIDAEPRKGVHGWIAFVQPRETGGILVELVERCADGTLQA